MIDVTGPEIVEVTISKDGRTLWVNIDGRCALRAMRIRNLKIEDNRMEDAGGDGSEVPA